MYFIYFSVISAIIKADKIYCEINSFIKKEAIYFFTIMSNNIFKIKKQWVKSMFLNIKLNKKSPVYIQIKDYIKDMILEGMFQKGEKLPATRELGMMLKVSRNTVITAYEYLEDEGFINIIKGKGAFVGDINIDRQEKWSVDWSDKINWYGETAEKLDIMKHEKNLNKNMISFRSISPDESLFEIEEFKRAFLNEMSSEGKRILNYGYALGYKPLIEYLLKYMNNKGVNTESKNIIVTNGFTEGFDLVLSSLTDKGDYIITENPTHNTAIKLMKLHQLNIIGIEMNEDGINIEQLGEKLSKNKVRLSYLIPSYHNPTGIVMSSQKRVEVYNILKKYEVPIIEDGFNEELRYSGAHVAPIAAVAGEGNSVVYIGSFSKILFPGLRIGWILADNALIDILESVKRSRNIHTSFLDQAVLYQYLIEGNFEKYLKKARKEYKEKYKFAVCCAEKYIPYERIYAEAGLHIFMKLGNGISARKVLEKCCENNVIFTPGDIFYVDADGDDTLRLGISRNSMKEVEEGFRIIGSAVKHFKK